MNKTELLTKLSADADERLALARVMDKLELARNRSVPAHTFFLTLAQQEAAERLIAACGHPAHLFWGGWEGAERKLIAFLPDWMEPEDFTGSEDAPIAALTLTPSGEEKLTHRDYLGAILGLGLTREKIGDLLVGEGVCQVLLLREVAHVLLTQLDQVGRARVKVTACPLSELRPPEQKTRTIRDTVAALRLDAVASTGFSLSRSKMTALISSKKLTLNGRECDKPDRLVEEGDVLTCRGLGKCVLTEVSGTSKKGRIMIVMERYL